ncbi:MAG: hypothetical protein ABFR32_09575 [Bacteroidota bacterium]
MKIKTFLITVLLLFTTIFNAQIKYNKNIPNEAHQKINQNLSRGISSFTFSPNGGWVIITNKNNFYQVGIPSDTREFLKHFKNTGHKLKQVSFAPKIPKGKYSNYNAHVIVTNKGAYGVNIPKELKNKISDFQKKGKKIKSISFPYVANSTNAWVIIASSGEFYARGIPDECYKYLKKVRDANNSGRSSTKLTQVSFTPSGGWVILADDQFFARSIPDDTYQQLKSFKAKKYKSTIISFTPNGKGWSLIANEKFSKASKDVFNKTMTSAVVTSRSTTNNKTSTSKTYKLRITLENFECEESDDSDDKDDYVFNQWIEYSNKRGARIPSTDFYMNVNASKNIKPRFGGNGKDVIFKGDIDHQFWVKEGSKKPIGNYIVFEITSELLNDSYSKFIINNNLQEVSLSYISTKSGMTANSGKINVDVRRVVKDLVNIKNLRAGKWTNYDRMRLRKYNNNSMDLYGYINFKSSDGERKARAKMRFKLID